MSFLQVSCVIVSFTCYHSYAYPDADYRVEDRKIPVEGGEITIRCLVPTSESGKTFPVLVWFHGGGTKHSSGHLIDGK